MSPTSPDEILFEQARQTPAHDGDLVSVIVTLFNYAAEVSYCLDSVLAQSHTPLELIVVDDASRDESAGVAREWMEANAHRFERTVLIGRRRNQGLSASRNQAIEAARGEFVFILDADNILRPNAIGRLLETLWDTGAAAAYSQVTYFGVSTGLGVADVWRADSFRRDNYVDAMALIRKSAWREVGGYSAIDYGWEDYDLWCKFLEAGLTGVYVPELLCRYRVHQASMLRTDTTGERTRLVHWMMAAHPWLDLRV